MNGGITKIIDKIMQEAVLYEDTALREAESAADLILEEYKSKAETAVDAIIEKSKRNTELIIQRAESGAELIRRNKILAMKSEILDEVFNTAVEKIINGGENDYLEFMVSVAVKAIKEASVSGNRSGIDIIIIMNKKDMQKCGIKLIERVSEKLDKPDLKLLLSDGFAEIKGGLIIRYGNIDVNCSVETIVGSMRPGLEAETLKILFENN